MENFLRIHKKWREILKIVQIEKHSVGPGIWQETVKNVKYKKYTLRNLDFGEKIEKRGK
jgi:hypothetical protein